MELTLKDVRSIIGIIDAAQHLDEIELVFAGFRLHVRRGGSVDGGVHAPAQAYAPAAHAPAARQQAALQAPAPAKSPAAASTVAELAEGEVAIRAPMVGTFYRAASPGDKPFVEVGQRVKADDNIGVIEVMKLFNTIRAGVDGTVVRIQAENATLVEFNQILVVISKA